MPDDATAAPPPDHVPTGGPPEPAPPAPPSCEDCRHPIAGRAHINLAGYGDPAKHCQGCEQCDRLRALWRQERRRMSREITARAR